MQFNLTIYFIGFLCRRLPQSLHPHFFQVTEVKYTSIMPKTKQLIFEVLADMYLHYSTTLSPLLTNVHIPQGT